MMKVFVYDGSFEGLLTTLFDTYKEKGNILIFKKDDHQLQLLLSEDVIHVPTSKEKSDRIYKGVSDKLGSETLLKIYYLYLSELEGSENLSFEYLHLCYKHGSRINLAKHNEIILRVDKYCHKTSFEAHRFTGFVRFKEIAPLTYYSAIEPDHNILPIISGHFEERFSDQNYIIHDLKREMAIVYDRKETILHQLSCENGRQLQTRTRNNEFEALWKNFYESINIEERRNEKLRRQFLPKRYWKHLTELS